MKRFVALISLLLSLCLAFCACNNLSDTSDEKSDALHEHSHGDASLGDPNYIGDNSRVVMTLGDNTLTEKEYRYIFANAKTNLLLSYQNYMYQLTGTVYDEASLLEIPVGESTLGGYIESYSTEVAKQMLIIESLCDEAGISITDKAQLADIESYISGLEDTFGGSEALDKKLAEWGFSRGALERFEKLAPLNTLYSDYRYGENGKGAISKEDVEKYFADNYIAFDGCMFSYADFEYDFSDNEIKDYFDDNFVKVRHVLYMTLDNAGAELPEAELAAKKASADAAFNAIKSGEKTIYDFESENEDSGSEYVFTKGVMVKAFEEASFEMAVGETRLVKTEYGYHLIYKLDMTDKDMVKKDVVDAMKSDYMYKAAQEVVFRLDTGAIDKYYEETDEMPFYKLLAPGMLDKTDSNNASFISLISQYEKDTYNIIKMSGDGAVYILRNKTFTAADITDTVYNTIYTKLKGADYETFLKSYYNKVVVDNEALAGFDVTKQLILDEAFYNGQTK